MNLVTVSLRLYGEIIVLRYVRQGGVRCGGLVGGWGVVAVAVAVAVVEVIENIYMEFCQKCKENHTGILE